MKTKNLFIILIGAFVLFFSACGEVQISDGDLRLDSTVAFGSQLNKIYCLFVSG